MLEHFSFKRLAIALVSGLIGVVGLTLCNGLLAQGSIPAALALTILVAVAMSTLCVAERRIETYVAAVVTGIAAVLLAGPNASFFTEFGIDRFVLLKQQIQLFATWSPSALSVVAGAALACVVAAIVKRISQRIVVKFVLVIVVINFVFAAATVNPLVYRETAAPPAAGEYVMDSFLYLRIHYLMQNGENFYQAIKDGQEQHKGGSRGLGNVFNWRPPVIFLLWQLVPGGPRGLLYAFWLIAAIALIASFGVARFFVADHLALGSPVLLGASYLYGAATIWFPTQEYWASFFMIIGLWAWLRHRAVLGAIMWALAITTREHFGFLFFALGAVVWQRSGRERACAFGAILLSLLVYIVHYSMVVPNLDPGGTSMSTWTDAGPLNALHCLQFGSVYVGYRSYLLLPLQCLGVLGVFMTRQLLERIMLGCIVLIPLLSLFFFGTPDRLYWGLIVTPQLMLCVPFAFARDDVTASDRDA